MENTLNESIFIIIPNLTCFLETRFTTRFSSNQFLLVLNYFRLTSEEHALIQHIVTGRTR